MIIHCRMVCATLFIFMVTTITLPGVDLGRTPRDRGRPPVYTEEALHRLSQVFGIDNVPTLYHHRAPPEYMLELYRTVAYSDGISRRANPYHADVIRGFPDRATRHQTHYYFNVSFVDKTEDVLAAELRLYKMAPDYTGLTHRLTNTNVIVLRLYQVLSEDWEQEADSLGLLDQRRISGHTTGWQVFTVTQTMKQWVNRTQTNHGFLVTATTLDGTPVNGTHVRFAQRLQHHDSKQPVLVVYSGDMVTRYVLSKDKDSNNVEDEESEGEYDPPGESLHSVRQSYIRLLNEEYRDKKEGGEFPHHRYGAYMGNTEHSRLLTESRRARLVHGQHRRNGTNNRPRRQAGPTRAHRDRRAANYYKPSRRKHKACQRNELYVDFSQIGWSGWIISPKGYNAYHCWGECPFPLGQYHRPTNHATVQSIVHTMRIGKNVQLPCCVPDKLYAISLLYFDDEENVILKQYDEMVAASCGCH